MFRLEKLVRMSLVLAHHVILIIKQDQLPVGKLEDRSPSPPPKYPLEAIGALLYKADGLLG